MATNTYLEFNKWCLSISRGGENQLAASQVCGNNPTKDSFERYLEKILAEIPVQNFNSFAFNVPIPEGEYELDGTSKEINAVHIGRHVPNGILILKNLRIWSVSIDWGGNTMKTEPIRFENCDIANLHLNSDSRVALVDSKVGNLNINQAHQIHMKGGCVLNIQIPAPGNTTPLTGSVLFAETFFPRKRGLYLLPGAQPYRNMRHHLRTIENGHMADLFHSAELAVERQDDTFINRMLSHAYELFSDFGSSALRPLLWWLLLFVLTVAIIFHADGAVQAFVSDDYYQGWRSSLLDSNAWYADLLRSGYLAFRSMINPLGLFGVRELLAPATGWLVIYLSFAGLLSVVLITLFVLAVRRRFKMQV